MLKAKLFHLASKINKKLCGHSPLEFRLSLILDSENIYDHGIKPSIIIQLYIYIIIMVVDLGQTDHNILRLKWLTDLKNY